MKRRKAYKVMVGGVAIGGASPVSIQSMVKTRTGDVKATVASIRRLEAAGCELIRVAIKDEKDAAAVRAIRRAIHIPLICDIHFNYRLALLSIKNGADKIRLNPGNISDEREIGEVVAAAKRRKIPIRIGANSGSIFERTSKIHSPREQLDALVSGVLRYIRIFERRAFRDIVISLKASDVPTTVAAYRALSRRFDYPLHLGVTAAGGYDSGVVKSAIGIGALLLDGIGDTIRVSLTDDPAEEVIAAKRILSAVGARSFGPEVISCPTCGRCQVDLVRIVRELEDEFMRQGQRNTKYGIRNTFKVAVMGCEVNGPGEAREADFGIAAGKDSGALFVKGKIIKRVPAKDFVKEILRLAGKM